MSERQAPIWTTMWYISSGRIAVSVITLESHHLCGPQFVVHFGLPKSMFLLRQSTEKSEKDIYWGGGGRAEDIARGVCFF